MAHLPFDEEYVRKLAAGDPEVQQHFITHFSPLLRVKLRSKLRSPQLIEDVRQETFLRVLQTVQKEEDGGLRNPERLAAYVNSVCNNVVHEALRSAMRHSPIPDDVGEMIDETDGPAQQVVTDERKRLVQSVLAELPAKDRDVLRQVYFEERAKADICREMKVNTEYLRVLIYRAKNRFRELVIKKDPKSGPENPNL